MMLLRLINFLPSTTFPSLSVLQALMKSVVPGAAYSSKQCGLCRSDTSRTSMFSRGMIPRGSLSVVYSK